MVVYADILIVLNFIVDYFLLLLSSKFLKLKPKLWRMMISAFLGGLSSLYIFLPQGSILTEFAVKLVINSVMSFVCFGFKNLKYFLKTTGIFFVVTCLYAGIMIALWQILRPKGMVINNSVVYFNISPIVLIGTTVIGYILYIILSRLFAGSAGFAERCVVTIFADGKSITADAIIDTGNSITDIFGKSEIIISDKTVLISLFGNLNVDENEKIKLRYRTVPCGTVSGGDVLEGFRCDSAKINYNNKFLILEKPILALSKIPLKENYSLILNPKIFNTLGDKNDEHKKLTV